MSPSSLAALPSSAWGCNFPDCSFPAPDASIFFFDDVFTIGPFGINKAMIQLFIGVIVVIAFFWYAFRKPQIVPRGAQNVGEVGYGFIRDGIARDIIGKDGQRFVPLLFSFFFFVWVLNFMGIFPTMFFPVTSVFAIPVAFALIVYLTWVPLGIARQGGWGFFKNIMFPPGLPKPLYILMAPIEFISNLVVRPFTHCVRLFANMFAGHLLIATFTVAAWYLFSATIIGALGSAVSFVLVVVLTAFELLIQALQAYIFTLLTAVYISGALHAEH